MKRRLWDVSEEDLRRMYIDELKSIEEISVIVNWKPRTIKKWIGVYDLHRTKEQSKVASKRTKLLKYGSETYNNREQAKKTFLEKYGVENPSYSQEIIEKIIKSNKDTYATGEPDKKIKKHFQEKYGVDYYCMTDECQSKSHTLESNCKRLESYHKTMLERYGVEWNWQMPEYKLWYKTHAKEFKLKEIETKRRNGTLNSSKPEEIYYKQLCDQYGEDDIIREYAKDERYPFNCDFYIISEDKFIELNYHWTHGGHMFNPHDDNDLQTLAKWSEKALESKFYKTAIDVWTIRDILKFEYARKNNLNYLALYGGGDLDHDKTK